jgi:ATP-dependent Lon protease
MTNDLKREIFALPVLSLRDVIVYPHMVIPLFVGRKASIVALERAMENDKRIVLVAQKDPSVDNPKENDIYKVGTVATVLQMLKLPDGTLKVLVEGQNRCNLLEVKDDGNFIESSVEALACSKDVSEETGVLVRSTKALFEQYVNLNKKIPVEVVSTLSDIDDADRLADTVVSHMTLPLDQKQMILELDVISERLKKLISFIDSELDLLKVEEKIRGRVKKQMEKSQKEYYLNEQMKAIQKELGDQEGNATEADILREKIENSGMPKSANEKAFSELNKLKMMSPMSAEASVIRNYLDWMVKIPWKKRTKIKNDLNVADKILNADHHGLEEVKERILEFLAVQKRVKKLKGPILCLVGPPGVGKTSLGESIAKATGRKFGRMSLGGVRDEAEIRGHRRTYIGSLPGKLIQKLSKIGTKNPLFLLDEIDKMGMDYRGDPASALLEVLDPEQNHSFNDHYLEVDYDLSEVMFICTANSLNIPGPLLDRMEIIRIPGYTEDEKVEIADKYLIPKQIKANGLKESEIEIEREALKDTIRFYTKEAGVRGLEKAIAKICRKIATKHVKSGLVIKDMVQSKYLEELLGVRKFDFGRADSKNQIGQVTGLAWTQVGGELLNIETSAIPGSGKVIKTGSLGDVMQESIQAALTVVRNRAQSLGIYRNFYNEKDLHIHVPEGATPKDGPSAGIGMCTSIVSVLTGIPVRSDTAMTGEITLHGQVLKIGGLKEKLLAAHRGGIKNVIIPQENAGDLKEVPKNITQDLKIKPVSWIDEVLQIALESKTKPLSEADFMGENAKKSHSREDNRPSTH